MSASLLRKGLELLEMPEGVAASRPKRTGAAAQPSKPSLTRRRRKKKMVAGRKTGEATVKGKTIKSALEEYKKHQAVDHFQENIQYMLNSQFIASSTITQKVLAQNRGRKSKDRPQEKAKKKPESTVFTEEDFQKFEREYFGGAGAK